MTLGPSEDGVCTVRPPLRSDHSRRVKQKLNLVLSGGCGRPSVDGQTQRVPTPGTVTEGTLVEMEKGVSP